MGVCSQPDMALDSGVMDSLFHRLPRQVLTFIATPLQTFRQLTVTATILLVSTSFIYCRRMSKKGFVDRAPFQTWPHPTLSPLKNDEVMNLGAPKQNIKISVFLRDFESIF